MHTASDQKLHRSINTEVSIRLTLSKYLVSSLMPRSFTSVRAGSGYTGPSQNLKVTNENIKRLLLE